MHSIDLIIVVGMLLSAVRGYHIGLIRQAGSTIGFVLGIFVGSWIGNFLIHRQTSSLNKSLTSLLSVLVVSFIFMSIGEALGIRLKRKFAPKQSLNRVDGGLGSLMSAVTILLTVWFIGAIVVLGPAGGLQQELRSSRILAALDDHLPPVTKVLGSLNKLIDPNGFPQVFSGLEPSPTTAKVPDLGSLNGVVAETQASVVKVEGTGCGGIVEGSGFVIATDEIATNAHVVAGVNSPKVIDANGIHNTKVVLFDPEVDVAVLRVSNLAGKPLAINSTEQPADTAGVVLGYPGGGSFNAQPAGVIERFAAYGRDIYGAKNTTRDVYSLSAKVIPGNSGGPLVGTDGSVLGIVFATSTTYNNLGYALTGHQVATELAGAVHASAAVNTGSCAE